MDAEGGDRREFERSFAARLIRAEKIDQGALERVHRIQAENRDRLEALLVKLGYVSERDAVDALAAELGLPIVRPADYPETPVLNGSVSKKFLHQAGVLPLSETAEGLVLGMVDPLDLYAKRAMQVASGKPIVAKVALPSEFEAAFQRLYESDPAERAPAGEKASDGLDEELLEDVDRLRDLASEGPVIRLVNQLLARAVDSRASDIHIEPFQNRLVVRYRIDGVLREVAEPPLRLRAAITSRIKIMAKLNIAERRLPQDGRFRQAIQGRDYDLRISVVPTLHGEGVAMRILDRTGLVTDFGALGFAEDSVPPFLRVLNQAQGILLVTGPTGSGKTTTLYTSLMRLNSPEKKLFTVEDPIEYQLEGVNQIQVRPQIDLTFANVLRSILRQDPDIIMIGEMRDLETAQIAIQAALTGHLVLSTLHTNSAAATVTRLLEMGVEDYLVTSTLNAVLAQRLVRRLCPHCREAYTALPELAAELRLPESLGARPVFHRARGCPQCLDTGYLGRLAVTELLVVTDEIRRLVLRRVEAFELHRAAVAAGMRSMYDDGIRKAAQGHTSLEEVLRVTRDI